MNTLKIERLINKKVHLSLFHDKPIAMDLLSRLNRFGVSETQIKKLFAQHMGEEQSWQDIKINENSGDPEEEKDHYASEIKSISVSLNEELKYRAKRGNFMVKTPSGMFLEKVKCTLFSTFQCSFLYTLHYIDVRGCYRIA